MWRNGPVWTCSGRARVVKIPSAIPNWSLGIKQRGVGTRWCVVGLHVLTPNHSLRLLFSPPSNPIPYAAQCVSAVRVFPDTCSNFIANTISLFCFRYVSLFCPGFLTVQKHAHQISEGRIKRKLADSNWIIMI